MAGTGVGVGGTGVGVAGFGVGVGVAGFGVGVATGVAVGVGIGWTIGQLLSALHVHVPIVPMTAAARREALADGGDAGPCAVAGEAGE